MKKKGLVYRMTMILGMGLIGFQFGGEVFYAKYFREERDEAISLVSKSAHSLAIATRRGRSHSQVPERRPRGRGREGRVPPELAGQEAGTIGENQAG